MLHKHVQWLALILLAGPSLVRADEASVEMRPSVTACFRQTITDIYLDNMPARQAIELFSRQTEIPIVANWPLMEAEGVDPNRPVTLDTQSIPAQLALTLILQQVTPGVTPGEPELIYETTPWFVHIQTKAQANRRPVLRVIDVSDMLMTIPQFTDAPALRLDEALQNDTGAVFEAQEDDQPQLTQQQRGDNLAQTIRDTIEPDIWQSSGGQYASIRYFNGRLIIRAPMYVQRQIDGAVHADHLNLPATATPTPADAPPNFAAPNLGIGRQ